MAWLAELLQKLTWSVANNLRRTTPGITGFSDERFGGAGFRLSIGICSRNQDQPCNPWGQRIETFQILNHVQLSFGESFVDDRQIAWHPFDAHPVGIDNTSAFKLGKISIEMRLNKIRGLVRLASGSKVCDIGRPPGFHLIVELVDPQIV